ncbi:enolase C-terminal domain-like protein [Halorubrum lipolyticum]|uniref:Mandelate racemase n=1 Tax=Halorubrum lipolyticum DSM 21995 TaxID=1227482 RepID=M0NR76_9EURY|nr:enolase C-terminal domain-like protein [Halorubrum lipolyticum]EMA59719.1 mandelate racemase [Halorubrum lipolyticum DSM 21995]
MEITDIRTIRFRCASHVDPDEKGHGHPGEPRESTRTVTRVVVDGGPDGYCRGGHEAANEFAKKHLVGENPLYREKLWQLLCRAERLNKGTLTDKRVAAIDCALWDAAGKQAGLPVYQLVGAARDSVPAYGSTMVGDDDPDGLGSPEAYADFAAELVDEGYEAVKLHTWMPPFGDDPERDIAACRAVRERVGDDVDLMLDAHHFYSRSEAKTIGRALEDLDFRWIEEPMDEHSMSSYEWLSNELDIAVVGPETAEGRMHTRAEWIKRDIADIIRVGVYDVGGITPALKAVGLCESFNIECEIHGRGAPNLHLLGTMASPGRYYERGLLHPKHDYETYFPGLEHPPDEIDENGAVALSQTPGLGYAFDWDYIDANRVE